MKPGHYLIDIYRVTVGHYSDSFERCKIGVCVRFGKYAFPVFEIPENTPDDQLEAIVRIYVTACDAFANAKKQINGYAKLN